MVKKEVFEWIRSGQKSIEVRRGKARLGDDVVIFEREERELDFYGA